MKDNVNISCYIVFVTICGFIPASHFQLSLLVLSMCVEIGGSLKQNGKRMIVGIVPPSEISKNKRLFLRLMVMFLCGKGGSLY